MNGSRFKMTEQDISRICCCIFWLATLWTLIGIGFALYKLMKK